MKNSAFSYFSTVTVAGLVTRTVTGVPVGSVAGFRPPAVLPGPLPRTYLVAGTREPFFRGNATRWADALREAGADVTMTERPGSHGDAFWRQEFPLMVAWAFGR